MSKRGASTGFRIFAGGGEKATGFSLVEVALALGVVAFALVSIFGLLSIGVDGVRTSGDRVEAANLVTAMLGQWMANPTNKLPPNDNDPARPFALPALDVKALPASDASFTTVPCVGANGYVAPTAEGAFRVTYRIWQDDQSATGAKSKLVRVHLILSSPPQAPLNNTSSVCEVLTSVFVK